MAHVYADRAVGRTPLGRRLDRRLLDRATCQAFRDIRGLAETAVLEAIDAAGSERRSSPTSPPARARTCCTRCAAHPRATAMLCDIDAGRARAGVRGRARARRAATA